MNIYESGVVFINLFFYLCDGRMALTKGISIFMLN